MKINLSRVIPYALLLLGAIAAVLAVISGDPTLALIGLCSWLAGKMLDLEADIDELKQVYKMMEREEKWQR